MNASRRVQPAEPLRVARDAEHGEPERPVP
jgi:hypothetical protein